MGTPNAGSSRPGREEDGTTEGAGFSGLHEDDHQTLRREDSYVRGPSRTLSVLRPLYYVRRMSEDPRFETFVTRPNPDSIRSAVGRFKRLPNDSPDSIIAPRTLRPSLVLDSFPRPSGDTPQGEFLGSGSGQTSTLLRNGRGPSSLFGTVSDEFTDLAVDQNAPEPATGSRLGFTLTRQRKTKTRSFTTSPCPIVPDHVLLLHPRGKGFNNS